MEYNVEYFIAKFEAIPEDKWCVMKLEIGDKHCALGHCGVLKMGVQLQGEGSAIVSLIYNSLGYGIFQINDYKTNQYPQKSPKQRILAALYDIRDKELSEANLKEASKIVSEEAIYS